MIYVAFINDDGLEIQDNENDDMVDRVVYCSWTCFVADGRTSTGLISDLEPDYCEYCGRCEKLAVRGLHPYGNAGEECCEETTLKNKDGE